MTTSAEDSTPFVRAVEPSSVVDRVAKEIRRSILSGALKPDQQFSLRVIAGQLGVSFIPVREALRQLEAQGLVVSRPGYSTSVAPLDHDDLRGIYRLRRQLEPEIAARSCILLQDADFARLEGLVEMFEDENLGIDEIYEAHHEFHAELLRPAATVWDLRILDVLWHAAERYVRLAFGGLDADPQEHSRRGHAHREILHVFRSKSPQQVALATLHHLYENEKIAQRALDPIIP
jgi:DNA-binding GntR family transcriptional regulator